MPKTDGTWVEVSVLPPCDLCRQNSPLTPAEELPRADFDASMRGIGTWAYMCGVHYALYGVRPLGTGRGQRLVLPDLTERESAMMRHPAGKGLRSAD